MKELHHYYWSREKKSKEKKTKEKISRKEVEKRGKITLFLDYSDEKQGALMRVEKQSNLKYDECFIDG
jgi:hypothetical protein